MDPDSILEIKHTICIVRNTFNGCEKCLDWEVLPERSFTGKLNLCHRELRNMIALLDSVDNSYGWWDMSPASRNTLIRRYTASQARDTIAAVDRAIVHLQHECFWPSPEMEMCSELNIRSARLASEAFGLSLVPSNTLMDSQAEDDFWSTMRQVRDLLSNLCSIVLVAKSDHSNSGDHVGSVMRSGTVHTMSTENMASGEMITSLAENRKNHGFGGRAVSHQDEYSNTIPSIGARDADISRVSNDYVPAMLSPCIRSPNRNAVLGHNHFLNSSCEGLPTRMPRTDNHDDLMQLQDWFHPPLIDKAKKTRRRRHRRRRNRHARSDRIRI